jgi:DNA-binding transcriptional ArsR family regulator
MLDTLITSKTRLNLLLKFFSNPQTVSYLRSLAEEFGESTNSVRVELNRLTEAGYLESRSEGNTIQYKANSRHPLYNEIRSVVSKYLGFDSLVEEIIANLGDVQNAYITGDYASGKDSGLIDLVIAGSPNREYLDRLVTRAEQLIHRRIRVLVLNPTELPNLKQALNLQKAILLFGKTTADS